METKVPELGEIRCRTMLSKFMFAGRSSSAYLNAKRNKIIRLMSSEISVDPKILALVMLLKEILFFKMNLLLRARVNDRTLPVSSREYE